MILTDSEIKRIAKEGDFLDCRYGISREFASTILELQKENARLKKTLERILELCEDQMSQDAEDDEVPQHDEFISIITIIQDSQKPCNCTVRGDSLEQCAWCQSSDAEKW